MRWKWLERLAERWLNHERSFVGVAFGTLDTKGDFVIMAEHDVQVVVFNGVVFNAKYEIFTATRVFLVTHFAWRTAEGTLAVRPADERVQMVANDSIGLRREKFKLALKD